MSSTTYPTSQPITNANLDAWLAERLARRFPNGAPLRTARVRLRVTKFSPGAEAVIVDRMADDMRRFGEGMTERDLRLAGYTEKQIEICAGKANVRALELANLN